MNDERSQQRDQFLLLLVGDISTGKVTILGVPFGIYITSTTLCLYRYSMTKCMEKIGFYPLTIILSYLTEKEGVLLLITKRRFASKILPIFLRSPTEQDQPSSNSRTLNNLECNNGDNNETSTTVDQQKRRRRKFYQFKVSPVQDPNILLDRLNTRRLYKRSRQFRSTSTTAMTTINTNHRTISEIANLEWQQQQQQQQAKASALLVRWPYPPKLELLRFKSTVNFTTTNNDSPFQNLHPLPSVHIHHRHQDKITLLVSYPRSGNTLLRTLLERTTGYVTGSDTRPDRSLSKELAEQHNLVGEGITASNRVLYVKTHYPERLGHQIFQGHSAILVVRNPYDAIDSYWNMNATKSHTKSLTAEMYQQYSEMWNGLVQNEIHIWNKFLEYWLNEECSIPVLVVRFEDLIRNPSIQLQRILEFTIQQQNSDNYPMGQQESSTAVQLSEYWMSRIQHCCNTSTTTTSNTTETLGSYQPRSATSGASSIGKSLRTGHYAGEMIEYIHQVCAMNYSTNYLRRFGYDIPTQNFPNNFMIPHDDDDVSAFKKVNVTKHSGAYLRVNDGIPIRPVDCPYGRRLQQWRHSVTDNDRKPLPTVAK